MTNDHLLEYLDGLPEERYALHGAREKHWTLEPAFPNQPSLKEKSYNRLAVYGTLMTEIALLYATIHEYSQNWGWLLDLESDSPGLIVRGPKGMEQGDGYVHILYRNDFQIVVPPGLVCISANAVQPFKILEVPAGILDTLQKKGRVRFEFD